MPSPRARLPTRHAVPPMALAGPRDASGLRCESKLPARSDGPACRGNVARVDAQIDGVDSRGEPANTISRYRCRGDHEAQASH